LNHGKEVGGELVVGCGDTAKVLQPGEEALDQISLKNMFFVAVLCRNIQA
jgi:hypothetical protein